MFIQCRRHLRSGMKLFTINRPSLIRLVRNRQFPNVVDDEVSVQAHAALRGSVISLNK